MRKPESRTSIEQVLEQRLRRDAYGPQATTATPTPSSISPNCGEEA
ncbi:hypothetical protein [Streptomyces sp. NPDC001292]